MSCYALSSATGIQCKEEIQESVTWVRTPAASVDNSSGGLTVPCPGYNVEDNTTAIRKSSV